MVQVDLKGLATVTAKGRTYYYAWRGGPRVFGEPGSAEFVKSFLAAREALKTSDPSTVRSIVTSYRAGPFLELAQTTRRVWAPWLDRIGQTFGKISTRLANHPEKFRPIIRDWRNQWVATPRAADTALQVLSAVLSHGVDPMGVIQTNPCTGMKRLYSADRSDIIWTDDEILTLKEHCTPEVAWAVDLAAHTGLRQGDLVRLTWSDIKGNEIVVRTSKTGAEAHIPVYAALKRVLKSIPKRSPVILTNARGMPWGDDGHHLRKPFGAAKTAAKLQRLHFHDLRGTAATKFYIANLPIRVIAEIMAWDEDSVSKIIRKYVSRGAATAAIIKQMDRGHLQNFRKTGR
jgi:integrase